MKQFFILLLIFFCFQSIGRTQDSTDWILIYYVPYDNNLSSYSDSVVTQLESVKDINNVQVVLQVDTADSLGMYRYIINKNGVRIDTVQSEESTSQKQLTQYLKWVSKEFSFRKSAVFFLDHGGMLDEVGQDLQPDSNFLTTRSIRKSLHKFNKWNASKVNLLYLQVCAKASLAPLYELHSTSEYTLASQMLLGAPNYYYKEVLRFLSHNPNSSGVELAKAIAMSDRKDMISSLTCFENQHFSTIRSDFRKLVETLKDQPQLQFSRAPLHFDYGSDRYWDTIDFLDALDLKDKKAIVAREALHQSISKTLICYHYSPTPTNYSGVSIASLSKDRIRKYWNMKFYKDFKLQQLPIQ